jgi:hypothetical protein
LGRPLASQRESRPAGELGRAATLLLEHGRSLEALEDAEADGS